MPHRLLKCLLVTGILALATAPAWAQRLGCASVSISIRTGTDTVAPGTTVGIAGAVNNCSSRKERYAVVITGMSSCVQKAEIASARMFLDPDENTLYSYSYPMPIDTCSGPWTATVQVMDGHAVLSSASTTLAIE